MALEGLRTKNILKENEQTDASSDFVFTFLTVYPLHFGISLTYAMIVTQ